MITTGANFNCLARRLYVWDDSDLESLWVDPRGAVLTCSTVNAHVWDYKPITDGGNIPTRTILRDPDGHAFVYTAMGELKPIADGGTYLCLAKIIPVIWNTPAAAIEAWPNQLATPADCNDAGFPD